MMLQAASSAFKAAKQAQCIRQLSKEDRDNCFCRQQHWEAEVQPQNLRFHDKAAPVSSGTPMNGPVTATAVNQCDKVAGDLLMEISSYSIFKNRRLS